MRQNTTPHHETLTQSDLLAEHDVDYVETFRRLAEVNAVIERRGEAAKLMLQRSILYHALGDYARSTHDAGRVVWEDPGNQETHYRLAVAQLAWAARLQGVLTGGLGATETCSEDPYDLLVAAWAGLRRVCSANPEDEEARLALATTQRLLTSAGDLGSQVWRTRWERA